MKNFFTVVFGICAICITNYAAVAAARDSIHNRISALESMNNRQGNTHSHVVITHYPGNLASLAHRLYATHLKFSSKLAVSNKKYEAISLHRNNNPKLSQCLAQSRAGNGGESGIDP